MKIVNLTQHAGTAEQLAAGVADLGATSLELKRLLTFDSLPTREEIEARAAMIGGAPFLMAPPGRGAEKRRNPGGICVLPQGERGRGPAGRQRPKGRCFPACRIRRGMIPRRMQCKKPDTSWCRASLWPLTLSHQALRAGTHSSGGNTRLMLMVARNQSPAFNRTA